MSVAYQVKIEELSDGKGYLARWTKEPRCMAQGITREEVIRNIKSEIRFWIETCPCGTVPEDHVQIEVID